ncbi:Transferrin [Temnothorax longispinosus]|uniref:Transferrin n=1 Tax=Temnothorax longispinosus TaxID=300112 RepID=A0A4S2L5K1_9HYME|nr:Transferrin [Temnothorax longispinosus]
MVSNERHYQKLINLIDKFCAPLDTVSESACYSLQRGDSEVSCLQVQDNAECAIRLAEGQADFGVFNAEELLLTHQFYSSHIQPILQLRHKDRQEEEFEFQTVAVVPVDLTQQNILPGERLKNLKDSGFCHPGFSQSQWWNDYILKNFENSVNPLQCQDDVTAIENEIINLKNFFGKACRPGEWAADSAVDQELKKKYPELCALCDNEVTCSYDNMDHHGHIGALQCLARGKGKVAYAALNYVQNYLKVSEILYLHLRTFSGGSCAQLRRTDDLETNKCKWVAKAAKALGVAPSISCMKSNSTFQCFRDIQENRTDIMVIDSNYGYLARTVYDMSTVLYSETDNDKNSVTLAVVREPRGDDYPIKSFHDLKDKTACFPEYGGLTWLSFINTARTNDIISSKSCDYPSLVSDLLSGACTPGIEDSDHSSTAVPSDIASKLCSACRHQNNTSCAGNETNHYYGDRGAMRCLIEGAGDIAFVEKANILYVDYFAIDSNMYRVLCKNGSLAQNPGFTVDEFCALSVTIDSEIVGRRKDSVQISRTDTILALLKMEDWLGYRVKARRPIHMFGPFNDTRDLLFKDSSSGLVSSSSMKKTVLAYKELFSHVEECSNDSFAVTANFIFVGLVALYHLLSSHVR